MTTHHFASLVLLVFGFASTASGQDALISLPSKRVALEGESVDKPASESSEDKNSWKRWIPGAGRDTECCDDSNSIVSEVPT